MIEQANFPKVGKIVRIYLTWTQGLLVFYLVSPVISYLIFWELLPRFSLTLVFGALLVPTLGFRLLLFFTGQLPFRSRQLALGYLLLLWILVLQCIWFPMISAQVGSKSFLATIAFTFVGAWVVWLGGEALAYFVANQPSRLPRSALLAVYLSLAFIIVDGVIRGFRLHKMLLFAFYNPVSEELYNYLALSDSLAIVGLLLLGLSSGGTPYRNLIFYGFTLLLLLFSYSRASLFLFFLVGLLLLTLKYRRRRKLQLLLALWGLAVIIILIAFIACPIPLQVRSSLFEVVDPVLERVITPFTGSDLSMQSRLELLRQGFHLLEQHWLLGYFMGEVMEAGKGAYIHNWLSFWLAYGIGPFVLSIWLLLSLVVKSWCQRKGASLALIGFNLLVFALLAISLFRSYIWPYFWFSLSFAGASLLPSQRRISR